MKIHKFLAAVFVLFLSIPALAVNIENVKAELESDGAVGWIHGFSQDGEICVFTYRNPTNFFDYLQLSLIATTLEVKTQLMGLKRHDKVRVQGKLLDNPSPQPHVGVSSVEVVEAYQSGYEYDDYEYEAKIPEELMGAHSAIFLVHAIGGDGHILVVEYKDVVLPIFVKNNLFTKGLYRNDIVELQYAIQSNPLEPTHLFLDESAPAPLTVKESIAAIHGKPASLEGALIMFPQSPEIKFNIFAVQQELSWGLKRQYTLVNFTDMEVFTAIRMALQKAWDKYPGEYVNARNKLVSLRIRVKATGMYNIVDASQANPQILLDSLESIEIIEN